MKKISVIPMPNKITYLSGETKIEPSKVKTSVNKSLGDEEYILTVKNDGIFLEGGSDKAVFYGMQTLNQLGDFSPCVKIEDKPAFPYRGFMLDTVRHITSIEDTKKLIDAAASVKMNVMHWHLTDDQGFRIESSRRPKASTLGSVRSKSNFGNLKENGSYGGYFTVSELKEIVDYCKERYITVIPEFDIPGHSSALLHAYPELSCVGKNVEVKTNQGIFEDIICAGKDESLTAVYDILTDILEIFPSEYIHIGGDEAKKTHWKACPDCQKRIQTEKLRDEEELQGWFTNKIIAFLTENGRKAIVWNESLKSGCVKDAIVQRWMNGKKLCTEFANNGGKLIISDFYHYYCDYPYGMTPLKKTYKYNPVLSGLKDKKSVIGVEAPIWTEYINNFDYLCYMCFPRFTAVAETGWTEECNKSLTDFEKRFEKYTDILKEIGISPAPRKNHNPSLAVSAKELAKFFACITKK